MMGSQPIPDTVNAMFFSASDNFGGPPLMASSHGASENLSTAESEPVIPHPNDFSPLFTLIEDEVTGEQHHPHVHYIFSDDDTDALMEAVMASISAHGDEVAHDERRSQSPAPGTNERYIVVDLDASGQHVVSARSLSSRWQVAETRLTSAPTFGEGEKAEDAGMMLKIRGLQGDARQASEEQAPSVVLGRAQDAANGSLHEAMAKLAEQFEREMGVLRRLVDVEGVAA